MALIAAEADWSSLPRTTALDTAFGIIISTSAFNAMDIVYRAATALLFVGLTRFGQQVAESWTLLTSLRVIMIFVIAGRYFEGSEEYPASTTQALFAVLVILQASRLSIPPSMGQSLGPRWSKTGPTFPLLTGLLRFLVDKDTHVLFLGLLMQWIGLLFFLLGSQVTGAFVIMLSTVLQVTA